MVEIDDVGQVIQQVLIGKSSGFRNLTLLIFSVSGNNPDMVFNSVASVCKSHSNGSTQALSQITACELDPGKMSFYVSFKVAACKPEGNYSLMEVEEVEGSKNTVNTG